MQGISLCLWQSEKYFTIPQQYACNLVFVTFVEQLISLLPMAFHLLVPSVLEIWKLT